MNQNKQAESYKVIETLMKHQNTNSCLIELNDGRLASGPWDRTIKLWSTTADKYKAKLYVHRGSIIYLIQLKERNLSSGSDDCTIK